MLLEELAMINEDERAETRGRDHWSLNWRSVDDTETADQPLTESDGERQSTDGRLWEKTSR